MDAVDGKHARNTGRASPLGQLVDHGLDIFSYAFQLVMVIIGHRTGGTWPVFIYQAFCYITYYSHTWEEYYSGIFSTQIDGVGVSEFQILASLIILFIPLFGESSPFYMILGMPFGLVFSLFIFLLGILHVYTTLKTTFAKIPKEKLNECVSFYLPLIPIVGAIFVAQFLEISKKNNLEIMVLNGLVFSFLTAEQIIITTSKSKFIKFHIDSFIYFAALIVCLFVSYKIQVMLLSAYAAITLVRYLIYVGSVTKQIMKFLNIPF